MQTDEQNKFKKLILILAEEFEKDLSDERIMLWWESLKFFNYDDVAAATMHCLRTCKFMPRLADVLEILENKNTQHISPAEAWSDLLVSLRKSSAGDNELTKEAVRQMGGARHLAMLDMSVLAMKRKEFYEIYNSLLKKNKIEKLSQSLIEEN